MFEARGGRVVARLAHEGSVRVAFSPDDTLLATGSAPWSTGRNGLVNLPDGERAIANVAGSAGNTPLNGHGVTALTDGGFEC